MIEEEPEPEMSEDDDLMDRLAGHARQRWNASTAALATSKEAETQGDEDAAIVEGALERLAATRHERVIPMRRRALRWSVTGLSAAAAAALIVWIALPESAATLPEYSETAFEGGIKRVRSDDAAAVPKTPVFEPSSHLRWSIAPAVNADAPVDVRVRASGAAELCLVVNHGKRIADSGAVELSGTVHDLFALTPGQWTLTLLVGRRERLDELADPCAPEAEGVTEVAQRRMVLQAPTP